MCVHVLFTYACWHVCACAVNVYTCMQQLAVSTAVCVCMCVHVLCTFACWHVCACAVNVYACMQQLAVSTADETLKTTAMDVCLIRRCAQDCSLARASDVEALAEYLWHWWH